MAKVYPKIYLIKGFCNSYYIDDELKILIDAGADFKKPVDLLILTHLHPDHVFYASKIKERTNCKILIGINDKDLSILFKHFPTWMGRKIEEFRIDQTLNDGELIKTGSYELKVLSLPGHTLGSIGLYDKNHQILFSGDVIFPGGLIGRTDFIHSDDQLMKKTLKMLEKLKIKHLLAGH